MIFLPSFAEHLIKPTVSMKQYKKFIAERFDCKST